MLLPIAAPSDVSESPSLCSHLGRFPLSDSSRLPKYTSGRHIYPPPYLPYLKTSTRCILPRLGISSLELMYAYA
jgi:hypothetical protein